jgi:hypothetical protein
MGKGRNSKREIMIDVYKRLLNYGESDNIKNIKKLLDNDSKSCIIHQPGGKGWVTLDWIEKKPLPYGSPEHHRYRYLNDPLIEKSNLEYYVRKDPSKTNRNPYKEPLFRLKRNKNAFFKLQELIDLKTFLTSKYVQEVPINTSGLWHRKAFNFWIENEDKINNPFFDKIETSLEEIHHFLIIDQTNIKEEKIQNMAIALRNLEILNKAIKERPEFREYKRQINDQIKKLRKIDKTRGNYTQ